MNASLFKKIAGLGVLFSAGVGLMMQTGCSLLPEPKSDPTHYYVLTGPSFADPGPARAEGALRVGLRRVDVVPYLNGKAMIVRNATNEIAYQDFARWAELPAAGIERLVMARLQGSPRVGRVYLQPFPFDEKRDYDVGVSVLRCEGERKPDGKMGVGFVCTVEVTEAKPGGSVVMRKTFTAPQAAWDGKDFGKLAQLLGEAVAALGEEIVGALPAK